MDSVLPRVSVAIDHRRLRLVDEGGVNLTLLQPLYDMGREDRIESLPSSGQASSQTGWQIEFTAEAESWYMGLDARDTSRIAASLDRLARNGPALRRPTVGAISGSRHHNMKELRSRGGNLRALFAFDSQRRAVVLVGGDKTGDWKGWYKDNIPRADKLYDQHLRSTGKEGPWRPSQRGAGRSSGARSR